MVLLANHASISGCRAIRRSTVFALAAAYRRQIEALQAASDCRIRVSIFMALTGS
jgi:hypothetical protein